MWALRCSELVISAFLLWHCVYNFMGSLGKEPRHLHSAITQADFGCGRTSHISQLPRAANSHCNFTVANNYNQCCVACYLKMLLSSGTSHHKNSPNCYLRPHDAATPKLQRPLPTSHPSWAHTTAVSCSCWEGIPSQTSLLHPKTPFPIIRSPAGRQRGPWRRSAVLRHQTRRAAPLAIQARQARRPPQGKRAQSRLAWGLRQPLPVGEAPCAGPSCCPWAPLAC